MEEKLADPFGRTNLIFEINKIIILCVITVLYTKVAKFSSSNLILQDLVLLKSLVWFSHLSFIVRQKLTFANPFANKPQRAFPCALDDHLTMMIKNELLFDFQCSLEKAVDFMRELSLLIETEQKKVIVPNFHIM